MIPNRYKKWVALKQTQYAYVLGMGMENCLVFIIDLIVLFVSSKNFFFLLFQNLKRRIAPQRISNKKIFS